MEFLVRAVLSGIIVAAVALIARKSAAAAALIVSLPILSILAMIWIWRDTGNPERLASHAEATFFYVLPTLPMFLLMPWMLRHGQNFWLALLAGCTVTFLLYLVTIAVAVRFGVRL